MYFLFVKVKNVHCMTDDEHPAVMTLQKRNGLFTANKETGVQTAGNLPVIRTF